MLLHPFRHAPLRLMDKAGEGAAGGAGTPPANPPASGGAGSSGTPTPTPDVATMIANLQKEIAELKAGNKPAPESDSLADKARKEREEKDKKTADSKTLEKALAFNMGLKGWVDTNQTLLPKSIAGIVEQADKETYDTAIEKASAVKVGLIQEFFAQQSNLDLLTESQKSALEEFKKLTKNDKQERVQSIFETVFEPTFESLRRVKKAEQVNKGFGTPSDMEAAHKQKMTSVSEKYYLKKSKGK